MRISPASLSVAALKISDVILDSGGRVPLIFLDIGFPRLSLLRSSGVLLHLFSSFITPLLDLAPPSSPILLTDSSDSSSSWFCKSSSNTRVVVLGLTSHGKICLGGASLGGARACWRLSVRRSCAGGGARAVEAVTAGRVRGGLSHSPR